MSFRFTPEAGEEFANAVRYYTSIDQPLAARFDREMYAAVISAVEFPQLGRKGPHSFRKRRIKGFPYSIIFRPLDGVIVIAAVCHHRQQPDYWLDRSL